jgi:hypothetical protein
MTATSSLHPICLKSRTDCEITTIFQCFFLVEYIEQNNDIKVITKIPHDLPKIELLESGLKIFLQEAGEKSLEFETGGSFVITISDGSRYYAVYRSFHSRIFVVLSLLPLFSFTRQIFELIGYENEDDIPNILSYLASIPIYPTYGISYEIEFSNGTVDLAFNLAEQVIDIDIDYIATNILNPVMLIKAWESIILERKVLVISSVDSVITPCCEFLRKLVLPLTVVNTFVPLLPTGYFCIISFF